METKYKQYQTNYNIIYSTLSALYIQGLIVEPNEIYVSVLSNYHNKNISLFNVTYVKKDIYYLGSTYVNDILCYNKERSIVDLIIKKKYFKNNLVSKIINSIEYNERLVYEYAKKMGIYKKVKAFLSIYQDFLE